MAYISTEQVANIRKAVKKAFPEAKFSVRKVHYSSVHITLLKAPWRFSEEDYAQINHYHPHFYANQDKLAKIVDIAKSQGWYDRSDAQVDFFDTAYCFWINQGEYNKKFELIGK